MSAKGTYETRSVAAEKKKKLLEENRRKFLEERRKKYLEDKHEEQQKSEGKPEIEQPKLEEEIKGFLSQPKIPLDPDFRPPSASTPLKTTNNEQDLSDSSTPSAPLSSE